MARKETNQTFWIKSPFRTNPPPGLEMPKEKKHKIKFATVYVHKIALKHCIFLFFSFEKYPNLFLLQFVYPNDPTWFWPFPAWTQPPTLHDLRLTPCGNGAHKLNLKIFQSWIVNEEVHFYIALQVTLPEDLTAGTWEYTPWKRKKSPSKASFFRLFYVNLLGCTSYY